VDLRSHRKLTLLAALALMLMAPAWVRSAEYLCNKSLGERLAGLAEKEPNLVRVRELAESRQKRKVRLVEMGVGSQEDRDTRPALLVVAGIEGNDLTGPVVTVTWIERLIKEYQENTPTAELLKTTTLYVVPCLNPDAAERFFASPKVEGTGNGTPWDDDRDGLTDEDGPEDLNGDGLITMMRVEDKEGEYVLDPNDKRLLLKADPLKGEAGAWRLLPEGMDNDHDKRWGEDGPGGTNFNRNFPYDYQYFSPDAGVHPVSEDETRALAEFVVGHPNIGIILTYGSTDNLRKTPKAAASPGQSKPMEAVDEEDVGYYEAMGKLYRAALGLDKELDDSSEPGTFSDWMYFHRGRLSLAVRPWDAALAQRLSEPNKTEDKPAQGEEAKACDPNAPKEEKKPAKKDENGKKGDKGENRGKKEREQLAWFDKHAPEAFVAWEAIDHPDFPGQRVEVGGYRPFVQTNPPAALLGEIVSKHVDFLMQLPQRLPRIKVGKLECRLLAESLYEVEIHVGNTGFLPTALAHGETTREVYPTRVALDLAPECFLSGAKVTNLPVIPGSGGTVKARYTVRVADKREVHFEVISMLGGRLEGTVELLKTSEAGADRTRPMKDERHDSNTKE
jgi:hypothetical protein